MVLEFVKSQRGKPKLKHEGYLYCLLREKDGLKTWRCEKRQCKPIATTFEENVFTTREHLHEPDMKYSEQLKVLEKMKEKAANSNEQPRKIVQDTTATITSDCAVALPKYKSLARSIQRQRGWGNNLTTLKDMAIPSELQLTVRGENFLAYDSGSDDRETFIFSTEQNLDLLESTPQWHADGTFKCCPALFYQLYTVHGVLNGHTIPLVYMLLKRKTKKLYLGALNELKEINQCFQPILITIDFEIACLLAFEELFPKVSIKGKYISRPHFNSLLKKLVSLLFLQVASPKPTGAKYKTLD